MYVVVFGLENLVLRGCLLVFLAFLGLLADCFFSAKLLSAGLSGQRAVPTSGGIEFLMLLWGVAEGLIVHE